MPDVFDALDHWRFEHWLLPQDMGHVLQVMHMDPGQQNAYSIEVWLRLHSACR